jgi:AAA+ ATPase superfamily predicted ATPase
MGRFVGRENELNVLRELLKKKSASLVVIKGRRRIGKSRLVEELATRHPFDAFYRVAGLPPTPETTEQSQRDVFAGQLASQFGSSVDIPSSISHDWSRLFLSLSEKIRTGKVLLLFDEISWMGSKDPDFLGKLKDAWDVYFTKNDQLMFIVCGSVSTWIEKNILSSTGYVGRVSLDLTLKELPLSDCVKFWGPQSSQVSPYEKLKMLAVTGGIPLYLEHVRPDLSAEKNITALCFRKASLLFREFDNIFSDLFSKRSALYKKIVESLAKGSLTQEEISTHIGHERSGTLSEHLDDLITAGFIVRDRTWHLDTGRPAKLSRYRICDCYTRFYLKYIEPNKHKIEQDQFQSTSISSLTEWSTIMGLQFETLVLNNRKLIWEALKVDPQEIIFDNPFFQKKTKRHAGCQIDYLIQAKFNTVYICEIKFSQREIGASIIEEMKEKIDSLSLPRHFSYRPVLIHVNGVAEEVEDSGYFTAVINFGESLRTLGTVQ